MIAVDEESQEEGDEEGDDVDNAECERRLEHRAGFVRAYREGESRAIDACARIGAVGVGDEAQVVDTRDQGAHDTQVEEGDEEGVVSRAQVVNDGKESPRQRYHRGYEED